MGNALGVMGRILTALAPQLSGKMPTQVGEEWRVVKVDQNGDQFDVPEGFEVIEMDEINLFKYLKYLKTSMESGTIRFVRNINGKIFTIE